MTSAASRAARFAFALLGLLILIGMTVVSFGIALLALTGIPVARAIQRRRGFPLTTFGAWCGVIAAAAVFFAAGLGYGLSQLPPGGVSSMPDSAIAQQQRARTEASMPEWIRRMQRTDPASRAMQERVESVTMSRPFMKWAMVVTYAFMSALMGLLIGSGAWVGAILVGRGYLGRWPFRPLAAPTT